jgi:hypothetical protein
MRTFEIGAVRTLACGLAAAAALTACGSGTKTAAPSSTSSATVSESAASDAAVATAAENVMRDNFQIPPGQPFQMYECQSTGALCWVQYITGFKFSTGLLKVTVQVDRSDPLGEEIGKNTAKGVRNFIRADGNPIFGAVNWVVAVDGTGTDIAQESM